MSQHRHGGAQPQFTNVPEHIIGTQLEVDAVHRERCQETTNFTNTYK